MYLSSDFQISCYSDKASVVTFLTLVEFFYRNVVFIA